MSLGLFNCGHIAIYVHVQNATFANQPDRPSPWIVKYIFGAKNKTIQKPPKKVPIKNAANADALYVRW
jgi:hypothetical protein